MGNSNKPEKKLICQGHSHIDKNIFKCMGLNCNLAPNICSNCAYPSKEDKNRLTCKLCCVTEKMKTFNTDELEIDTAPNSHGI